MCSCMTARYLGQRCLARPLLCPRHYFHQQYYLITTREVDQRSSDEREPGSIYLFGSTKALVNIAYVYSSLCKTASCVKQCKNNGTVWWVRSYYPLPQSPFNPAHQLLVKYIDVFSLGIYDSFKHKREVTRVQGPWARIRPGTNNNEGWWEITPILDFQRLYWIQRQFVSLSLSLKQVSNNWTLYGSLLKSSNSFRPYRLSVIFN